MKTRSAATLAELMVVLVVVLVVASLSLAAQQFLDDAALRIACQNNLLAIHNVFMQYCANNEGSYPDCDTYYGWRFQRGFSPGTAPWDALTQVRELKSYGADASMFFCPMDANYDNSNDWRVHSWEEPVVLYGSYSDYYYGNVEVGYTMLIYRGGIYTRFLADGREPTKTIFADADLPIVCDTLHYRNAAFKSGWWHGGGPDLDTGLFNSGGNTLFNGGFVVWTEWQELELQGPGYVSGSGDMWWFALTSPMVVQAAVDRDWVYQNTPLSTANGGHRVRLDIQVSEAGGNSTVDAAVEKASGSGEVVVLDDPGGDPMAKRLFGSPRTDGADGTGPLLLRVTLTGDQTGEMIIGVPLAVRPLGDIDGNGAPEPGDVMALVMTLNGTPPAGVDVAAFDLDANGAAELGDVTLLINILNGQPVP